MLYEVIIKYLGFYWSCDWDRGFVYYYIYIGYGINFYDSVKLLRIIDIIPKVNKKPF